MSENIVDLNAHVHIDRAEHYRSILSGHPDYQNNPERLDARIQEMLSADAQSQQPQSLSDLTELQCRFLTDYRDNDWRNDIDVQYVEDQIVTLPKEKVLLLKSQNVVRIEDDNYNRIRGIQPYDLGIQVWRHPDFPPDDDGIRQYDQQESIRRLHILNRYTEDALNLSLSDLHGLIIRLVSDPVIENEYNEQIRREQEEFERRTIELTAYLRNVKPHVELMARVPDRYFEPPIRRLRTTDRALAIEKYVEILIYRSLNPGSRIFRDSERTREVIRRRFDLDEAQITEAERQAASILDEVRLHRITYDDGTPTPPTPNNNTQPNLESENNINLECIQVNDRDMRFIARDTLGAISMKNADNPKYYLRSGQLSRVVDVNNIWKIDMIDAKSLPGICHRAAQYFDRRESIGEIIETPQAVPIRAVEDVLYNLLDVAEDCKRYGITVNIQDIDKIVYTPQIDLNGNIYDQEGYIPSLKLYYHKTPGFVMETIPDFITKKEVYLAKRTIKESMCEIPFVTESDRTNYIAGIMTGLFATIIDGNLKFHVADKKDPRTGASLMHDLVSILVLGRLSKIADPENREEFNKRLDSALISGSPICIIDNLRKMYDSATFLSLATSGGGTIEIRPYGHNDRTIHASGKMPLYLNGINVSPDDEALPRLIISRLDGGENPGDRTGFKQDPIRDWYKIHAGEIVRAYIILVKYWIQCGKPRPTGSQPRSVGGYELWYHIIGGILECCKIPGLLENYDDILGNVHENLEFVKFLHVWYEHFPHYSMSAREGLTVNDIGNLIYKSKQSLETQSEFVHADAIMNAIPNFLKEGTVTKSNDNIFIKIQYFLRNKANRIYTMVVDDGIVDKIENDTKPRRGIHKLKEKLVGWNEHLPNGRHKHKTTEIYYKLVYINSSHKENIWRVERLNYDEDHKKEIVTVKWNNLNIESFRKKKLKLRKIFRSDSNLWCYQPFFFNH